MFAQVQDRKVVGGGEDSGGDGKRGATVSAREGGPTGKHTQARSRGSR